MLAKIIAYLRNQGSFCGEHYHKFRFEKPIVSKKQIFETEKFFYFWKKIGEQFNFVQSLVIKSNILNTSTFSA